jgi:hypothetical protein
MPLFTLRRAPHDAQRKTQGRAGRYPFLVRIFHPLLHAGLSRRTDFQFGRPGSASFYTEILRVRQSVSSPIPQAPETVGKVALGSSAKFKLEMWVCGLQGAKRKRAEWKGW